MNNGSLAAIYQMETNPTFYNTGNHPLFQLTSNSALMFKHFILAFAMLACTSLFGQSTQFPWEFGLQLGTSSVGGDLIENDIIFLNQPSFGAGLTLRRRLGNSFALRAHLMYGGLNADDSKSEDPEQAARGYTSETTVIEPGLILEFEPFAGKRFQDGQFK